MAFLRQSICLNCLEQVVETRAVQSALCAHHAHIPSLRLCKRGFECRFNAYEWQLRVMGAQTLNGHGCGSIASHHHRLQGAFGQKLFSDVVASCNDKVVAALAIGRIATVGPVNEALLRQFGTQGFQNTQTTNAAVKNADSPLKATHT